MVKSLSADHFRSIADSVALAPRAPAPRAASGNFLVRALVRLAAIDRGWRERRQIAELPDYLLRDIGVTREQLLAGRRGIFP